MITNNLALWWLALRYIKIKDSYQIIWRSGGWHSVSGCLQAGTSMSDLCFKYVQTKE